MVDDKVESYSQIKESIFFIYNFIVKRNCYDSHWFNDNECYSSTHLNFRRTQNTIVTKSKCPRYSSCAYI